MMSEAEPEPPANKTPLTYAQAVSKIDALWKQIRAFHQKRYMLSLRHAANLVGFWRFPVGWTWQEYDRWMEEQLPYELQAARLRHLDLQAPVYAPNDWVGRAEVCRMKEVEDYLLRFINRREVECAVYDDRGNAVQENFQHSVKWLNVRDSCIRYGREVGGCEVDALSLLDAIERHRKKRSRPPKYNWLAIERWVRNHIESDGLVASDSEIVGVVYEWYATRYGKDTMPTRSTLAEDVASLRREYQFPKTKSQFHEMQLRRR
jgi:hypothetical protein